MKKSKNVKLKRLDCLKIYSDALEYDEDHGDITWDIPFYVSEAKKAKGEVLELACGTARLTIPIAKANVKITGLDISKPLLKSAKEKVLKAGQDIKLIHADARDFNLKKRYDLIFMALNAFHHLHDNDSVEAFLSCVKKHLTPKGKFIFNVANPKIERLYTNNNKRVVERVFKDQNGRKCQIEALRKYDGLNQLRRIKLFFTRNGETFKSYSYAMRCFFPRELDNLLRYNGFKIENKYGTFRKKRFSGDDTHQILICSVNK
jgi:SAM-dependent methyltransferase